MESNEQEVRYNFGPFVLESQNAALWKGSVQLPLTRKRHEILLLLVKNAGRLMSKDEILEVVWPDQTVDEANLANNIHVLRRLIEDDPRNPKLILTVPGHGYKFVGEVSSGSTANLCLPEAIAEAPPPPRLKWRAVAILTAASILVIAVAIFFFRQNEVKRPSFPAPLTSYPGVERYPALSVDGKFIAFTWDGDKQQNEDIYVRQTIDSEPIRVTSHPSSDIKPAWSPDGLYIAFLRIDELPDQPNHLMIVPALGGTEREVARVDGGLDWSPDGRYLAVTGLIGAKNRMGIHLVSVDGNEQRRITPVDPSGEHFESGPRFSPDGRRLAFLRWNSDSSCDIFVADLQSGAIEQITKNRKSIKADSLHWSANGENLSFISNQSGSMQLWEVPLAGGEPRIYPNLTSELTAYSVSRNGNLLAFVNELEDTMIEIRDTAAAARPPCTINSTRLDSSPRFSPDGSQIVFSSNRTGFDEIWLARSDCTQVRQLTTLREMGVGSPRWSPDGSMVAFDRRNRSESDIYTISVNGTDLRKVTDSVGSSTMPVWSPDGNWIFFTSNRAVPRIKSQIWKIPVTGGSPLQVTHGGGWEANFLADGERMVFNHNNRLWELNLKTGEEQPIAELAGVYVNRDWEVVGNFIYYQYGSPGAPPQINRFEPRTRKITTVTTIEGQLGNWLPNLSVTQDERQLAISRVNIQFSDIMLIRDWR